MSAILTVQNITSDFVTTLWTPIFVGIFIAIVTYALWPRNQKAFDEASRMPLRRNERIMTEHSDFDQVSGKTTTGHEWDGIKELNTPLPRWWVTTFYLCIVWAIGYWIVYPAWPLVSGYTTGVLHYSSRADVAVELANLEKIRGDKMVRSARPRSPTSRRTRPCSRSRAPAARRCSAIIARLVTAPAPPVPRVFPT